MAFVGFFIGTGPLSIIWPFLLVAPISLVRFLTEPKLLARRYLLDSALFIAGGQGYCFLDAWYHPGKY